MDASDKEDLLSCLQEVIDVLYNGDPKGGRSMLHDVIYALRYGSIDELARRWSNDEEK